MTKKAEGRGLLTSVTERFLKLMAKQSGRLACRTSQRGRINGQSLEKQKAINSGALSKGGTVGGNDNSSEAG